MNIPLKKLKLPKPYIRRLANKERVQEYREIMKEHSKWPHASITISPPQKDGKHVIADGVQRYLAAIGAKLKELPAEIDKNITNAKTLLLAQLKYNVGGITELGKPARDRAIRILATKFKVSQEALGKLLGISQPTISRALRPPKPKPETPARDTKARLEEKEAKEAKAGFSAKTFFEQVLYLASELEEHSKMIVSFIKNRADAKLEHQVREFTKGLAGLLASP